MPDPARQRGFALEIVQKLRAAGFDALWAGGCVRDELLGLVPKDYDVATSAKPGRIQEIFGRRRTLPIGASFGVITVLGPRGAGQIEVATFRTDVEYSDGRHPDSVSFADAEHDAQRRDFTINGLFYDPIAQQVVDYVGGQEDLRRQVIRAIGDARLRFREDHLRMLRAVRFAATFGFQIEPATLGPLQDMAPQVMRVSAERIGMEIRRMLIDPSRGTALRLLRETGLSVHVLPEVARLSPDAFAQTLHALAMLHQPTLPLALAALLSRVEGATSAAHQPLSTGEQPSGGAPGSGLSVADSAQAAASRESSAQLAAPIVGRRLRYTNKEIERTSWLLATRPIVAQAPEVPWPRLQRALTHPGAAELLALQQAIAGTADPALGFCRERLAWPPERLNPAPLLDGSDLIAHGLEPGPQFAALLEKVRDAQLNAEIATRDAALALVDRLRPR